MDDSTGEMAASPWSSLLRNREASNTTLKPSSASIVAPSGMSSLEQVCQGQPHPAAWHRNLDPVLLTLAVTVTVATLGELSHRLQVTHQRMCLAVLQSYRERVINITMYQDKQAQLMSFKVGANLALPARQSSPPYLALAIHTQGEQRRGFGGGGGGGGAVVHSNFPC